MFDCIVVGSGAGGATVARELSKAKKTVLLVEKGEKAAPARASEHYRVVKSDVEIWYSECLGGTTQVTMGNAVRSGISRSLEPFFLEAEEELGVWSVPSSKLGKATSQLLSASKEWIPMPKCIDFDRCRSCGSCAFGCPTGAKWDASAYIREAEVSGCRILTGSPVKRVLIEGGEAKGVELTDGRVFKGGGVVVAAGAIETPRILQRSGFSKAGKGLFVDTFVTIGGVKKGASLCSELGMAIYKKRQGYLISPHYSTLLLPEIRKKGIDAKETDLLSLMVKIEDEPAGEVTQSSVRKPITERDALLLEAGKREALEILCRAGVEEETISCVYPRGAHPGGTCSRIVRSLNKPWTDVESLLISDASVLPGPFGLPPMLTIIAISKRVAALLLGRA
uniref:GMC family oxidoreductase n=1 Tax=Candidatus Methanomethylicus mesodigestus TaxID=1867258 RepID=A0A7C3J4X6_9CREN